MDESTPVQVGIEANHRPIPGSERRVVAGAKRIAPVDPNERITATVLLRHRASTELVHRIEELSTLPFATRTHMTHEEFSTNHGADPSDIQKIREFANQHDLTVEQVNLAARTVILSGTTSSFNQAFAVDLAHYEHPDFTYRGREGAIHVPEHLTDVVVAVLGLDNRPQASPHFRIYNEEAGQTRALASQISYTPPQVAQLYNFPTNVNCSDQCIGIIELGGGYTSSNIDQYFTNLGLPSPTVAAVSVDGSTNQPTGNANGPDGEVDLDIEVAAAVAPGARIVVYFAPNTDAGFLNAITTAIHDTTNKPSVISISWGGPESSWTTQGMQAMNSAFQDAAALGVTVCCASGDNGSTDGVSDGNVHVDFPASSPYALACGGTRLTESGGTIASEVVWNDGSNGGATGGGVSSVFALPSWQSNANVPSSANSSGQTGRGVPDVAGDADPASGYQVLVDGQQFAIGGTSAVAPLWAGLLAIANHTLGHPVGYVNPLLYSIPSQDGAFRDITSGNNDINGSNQLYQAGPGWDACTGLGSPNGSKLIDALSQVGSASEIH
ncbi:S53 family peptidase [Alicyclobacillus dauci]|uniref:S53 family peptidase n=1 Tax=Alicyclobacillus dauci TaxID=1475485 RepID=A0ABY6Z1L4_9BACL|nr:S53 family peptidase [Alicyclobacillus dauci]WAH36777.1 S53 family peptidase [Alicyclobacillus dauci]